MLGHSDKDDGCGGCDADHDDDGCDADHDDDGGGADVMDDDGEDDHRLFKSATGDVHPRVESSQTHSGIATWERADAGWDTSKHY